MACIITITSVTGVGSPLASVHVTGTATPGGCGTVKVTLQCSGAATATLAVPVDAGGNWTADFTSLANLQCSCGKLYTVFAECSDAAGCKTSQVRGELPCPQPGCPTAVVTVTPLGCNADGTRNVQLATVITGTGTIVTQWDFGNGSLGAASALLSYSSSTTYIPPGPYTATLNVIVPTGCPPAAIVTVGPLDPCPTACPTVSLGVNVVGCAGGGGATATATFIATLSPPLAGCTYHWNFGDGATTTTSVPTVTHNYATSGTFAASVAVVCGPICVTPMGITVTVNPCCPILDTVTPTLTGCVRASPASVATVTWVAATIPPGSAGTFLWQYSDGMTATTVAPSHTRTYDTTGTQSVTVTYTPSVPGCPQTSVSNSVVVPACSDDGSTACGVSAILIAALAALVLGAVLIGAVATFCLGLPLPGWYWTAVAAAAATIALVILITYILCWLGWCPCLTKCDWLKIAWIVALAAAVIALYFGGCCGSWWWAVILGLFASAAAALVAWRKQCSPTTCQIVLATVVALVTVAGTLFGFIALLGPLSAALTACAWVWVKVGAAALAGLLAAWAAANCTTGP
jgi:hypothetical protein